jgi:hypothetical protein
MLRWLGLSILVLTVSASSDARSQGAGAPLQLSPGGTANLPRENHAKIPGNWKIIVNKPDPLTDKPSRYAVDLPKTKPVFHGQAVTVALVMHCVTVFLNKPSEPELMLLFTGMTGIGHINNLPTNFRWDEGPIHSFMLKGTGKTGARTIVLPRLISPAPELVASQDPVSDIVEAGRLRVEVTFQSAGMVFLDFNVSGAAQAISALACQ